MFKSGDKVRLTEDFHYFRKGDTGIIVDNFHAVDGIDVAFNVQFDSKPIASVVVTTAILELIPETTTKSKTMNSREAYQALLDGETLVSTKDGTLCTKSIKTMMWFGGALPHPSELSIKQKTININGFEVPEPIRDVSKFNPSQIYYIPSLTNSDGILHCNWVESKEDFKFLHKGLVHLNEENAAKHAKALLSFTKRDNDE